MLGQEKGTSCNKIHNVMKYAGVHYLPVIEDPMVGFQMKILQSTIMITMKWFSEIFMEDNVLVEYF